MKLSKNKLLVNTSIIVLSISLLLAFRLIDRSFPDIHVLAYPTVGGVVQGEQLEGQVVVTAEANKGYRFLGWVQNGQVVSEKATFSFKPSNEQTITANFQKYMAEIKLVASDNLGGQVYGEGEFDFDEEITVIAEPKFGYVFEGWIKDGKIVSENLDYSFVVKDDTLLEARFKLDLKSQTLRISDGDYFLALVNKDTYLGRYAPKDLVSINKDMLKYPQWRYELREEASTHLEKMWKAAKEDGVVLYIASAYRSYDTQSQVFNDNVSRHGEKVANRSSARPGESEHQLGTAVDFVAHKNGRLMEFEGTPGALWLMENAHKYGFIMSYPKGKEEITGYIYEPWHYRYIGMDAAQECKESGLTLVEYLMTKPQFFENPAEYVNN